MLSALCITDPNQSKSSPYVLTYLFKAGGSRIALLGFWVRSSYFKWQWFRRYRRFREAFEWVGGQIAV